MAQYYQPKRFFRQVPNKLLAQYFKIQGVLQEIDFDRLKETKIEPIYEAWLNFPDDKSEKIESDFREIDALATEGGTRAILDEARYHEEDLTEKFSKLKDFHERSFWTFLNRKKYWLGAFRFYHADNIAQSYWRKRKNLPKEPAHVDEESIKQLEAALKDYFHTKEGRGRNCKVECYRRNELDYFYAYPEDYSISTIEWEKNQFQRKTHHPAFDVIFVYSKEAGTLDIYTSSDKKAVVDLQIIFSEAILKTSSLHPDQKDERVYDLTFLKSSDFEFVFDPASGIKEAAIKKMRLDIFPLFKERIILECDPSNNPKSIYDLFNKICQSIPSHLLRISQVEIKVTFKQNPSHRGGNTRTFTISRPNSCSLKNDGRDLVIRKMLSNSGIEPQEQQPVTANN